MENPDINSEEYVQRLKRMFVYFSARSAWFLLLVIFLQCFIISCVDESPKINLTKEEKIWLEENNGKINLLPCPDYPPIDFYDNNGKHTGLTAEYIRWIERELKFKFIITPIPEWGQVLDKAKNREADGVLSIQNVPDRRTYLNFTEPYITIPNIIVLRSSDSRNLTMDEMKGMRIAVVKGYAVTNYLVKKYPRHEFIYYTNELSGLMDVSFARIDSMVVSLSTASYFIDRMGISNLRVAGSVGYNWNLCIATRNDMPVLNSILNKTLAAIPQETRMEINRRWISLSSGSLFENRTFRTIVISSALSALFIVTVILLWNRALKKQVRGRTADLVRELKERRRAEKELSDEKERLVVTLRSIGDAFFSTDMNGRIVLMNLMAEKLTGSASADALGGAFSSICVLLDESVDSVQIDPAAMCISTRASFAIAESITLINSDGGRRSVTVSASPIIDSDAEMIGVVVIIRDITDQQLLQEELNKVQKLESLGLLAGGIAHDFNNILMAILGNSELIRYYMNSISGEEINKSVGPILGELERAVLRAKSLTLQLLTFSKGGKPILKTGDVGKLLEDTVNFSLRGTGVKAVLNLENNLRMVDFDEGQLSQVFNNLAINASQAMPSGGTLTVSASNVVNMKDRGFDRRGGFVLIKFTDTGSGIQPEIYSRIFDPFFTTKESGTGLGLTSSYSIISRHGGIILADSPGGSGAEFRIYLPVSKSAAQGSGRSDVIEAPARSARILLMDDDAAIRNMVTRMLSALGCQAESAEIGEVAVEMYKKSLAQGNPYNAVILDLTVPGGMGGIETMAALLKIDPSLKGIVASGYSDTRAMSNCGEFGFAACLAKPFTMNDLGATLGKILK